MDDTFVLGIDYGTESCRVALFDLSGHPLEFAATPYPTTHPRAGWAEQSPDDWWRALRASARRVLAASGVRPEQIVGIGSDATTMTVVAMDATGRELRPAIMWMDVRATDQAARAASSSSVARRYNGGGTAPATAEWYPFKAAWLRECEPETYRRAARLVDAPDWLTHKLTGEWTVNINSAALRMYYDRDHGGWPGDFYEHVGCGDVFDKIPERVVDLGTPVAGLSADAADWLGLRPGTPVAQGPADAWAGQIGLGVLAPGRMALITGSSHVLTGQTDRPASGHGFFGAYTDGVVPGQYTLEAGQASTGSVLKWFKDGFAPDAAAEAERRGVSVYDVLNERAVGVRPGCDGLIVNEYFQGNRTPYTDSKARGMVWGLSLAHTPAHLYRAIQEGICFGTAHNLAVMEEAGVRVDELVACGGFTRSRSLMQLHADIAGKPITLTAVGDAVALGAAIVAAVGAGVYPDLQRAAAAMVHDRETITPDPTVHEQYAHYLGLYRSAYPRMADLNHQLVDHETSS